MSAIAPRAEIKERPILFSGPMVRAILEGRKTQTRRVIKEQRTHPHLFEERSAKPRFVRFAQWHKNYVAEFIRGDMRDDAGGEMCAWFRCPYGRPGERLWVREKWGVDFNARFHEEHGLSAPDFVVDEDGEPCVLYAADRNFPMLINDEFTAEHNHVAWKSSIHMRRAASRLTLEITDVRVERLQEITEQDAIAEGMEYRDTGLNQYKQQRPGWSFSGETDWEKCLHSARFAFGNGWDRLNAARGFGWEVNPWVWVLTFRKHERVSAL